MANQIKKKYLSQEVISYFDDQISAVESDLASEVSRATSAEAALQGEVDAVEVALNSEVVRATAAESALDARLTTAEGEINTLQSDVNQVESDLAAEVARATAAEAALQSDIDTEKGRIDAILSASQADKDSFAEIVTLINSIDTENDQAFAGYVLSNNAAVAAVEGRVTTAEGEIDTLQSDVADHETRITALEGALAPTWAPAFKKDLDATDISNGYIDLPHLVVPNSVMAFVDRLAIHETEEFTVSTVGGVTRLTFTGPLVSPGQQSLDANDNIYVKYQYLA